MSKLIKKLGALALSLMLVLCLLSPAVMATSGGKIYTVLALNAESIAASGNASSSAIHLGAYQPWGFFSVQVTIAGTGTAKVEYLLSHDNSTFSDCGTDIATGLTAGTQIYAFPDGEPVVAPWMKIKVTETGGANGVTATVYVCMQ